MDVGGFTVSMQEAAVVAVGLLLFTIFFLFVKRTKLGKALRAVSQNKEGSRIVGIPIKRIYAMTWGIGLSFAGVAGALVGPLYAIYPLMGFVITLKAFAAIIMGGFGNVQGAIYSAYILGMAETLVSAYMTVEYKDAVAFSLLIIVLLFKPYGIFGKKVGI